MKELEEHSCPHVRAGDEPWLDLTLTPTLNRHDNPETPAPTRTRLCQLCAYASVGALEQVRVPGPVAMRDNPALLALMRSWCDGAS